MEIKYTHINNGTICIFQYNGVYDMQKHFDFARFRYSLASPLYKDIEFTIVDLRNAEMSFPTADLTLMSSFRKDEVRNNARIIYLVDAPRVTAFIHIYCQKMQALGFDYTYCSTIGKACIFMGYRVSPEALENALDNLDLTY